MSAALVLVGFMAQVLGCSSGAAAPGRMEPAPVQAAIVADTTAADLKVETREELWPSGIRKQRTEGYVDDTGEFIWHGMVEKSYESGQPQFKGEFRDGLPHGEHTTWYLHGQMWGKGNYVDGLEDGKWVKWHQNGQLYSEWTMNHGAWDGIYTEWHSNGKKRLEVEFVKGLRQGSQYMWDEQGVLMQVADYVNSIEQP